MTAYTPHVSDVEMIVVYHEPACRVVHGHGGWVTSLRRCPECGYPMVSNKRDAMLCNRCGYAETKSLRKYAGLAGDRDTSVSMQWRHFGG